MDNTDVNTNTKIKVKRQRLPDGTISFLVKRNRAKKKRVLARGKGEKTVGKVIVSQLEPFRSHMEKSLRRRGYNVFGVPFKEMIPLYYNEFVSHPESPFTPISNYEFRNNPVWNIRPSSNLNGDINDHRNRDYFVQVGSIVDNIISVFSDAKAKKQAAINQGVPVREALTSEEIGQAKAAEKVERKLENQIFDNQPVKWKTIKKLFILGIVIFGIYHLLK
jgi:hypothetical protein